MTSFLRFVSAAALFAIGSAAAAQAPPAVPLKNVSRGDYLKNFDNHFAVIDANHDGNVSKAELVAEQQREMDQAKSRITQQMATRFKQLDTNKDGQLTFQEFLAAAPPVRTLETPDQLLQQLDTNKDGKVSAEEFRAPQVAKFNKVDTNHDGIVSPAEIKAAAGQK